MRRPFIFTSLGVVKGESKRGNRKCGPENWMEPVVLMPAALAGHAAKYCNHMVNSPDEITNTGDVYNK